MMSEPRFLIQFRKDSVPVYEIHELEISQIVTTVAEYMNKDSAWYTDINLIGPTLKRLHLGQLHFIATTLKADICITKTYEDDATIIKISNNRHRVPLLPESDDESEAKPSDNDEKSSATYLECKVFCIRNTNSIIIWLILKARDLLNYIANSDYVKLNQTQPHTDQ